MVCFRKSLLITRRDAHLLATLEKDCTTYQVRELDKHEALELFNQHAFKGNKLEKYYFELAKEVGVLNLNLYGHASQKSKFKSQWIFKLEVQNLNFDGNVNQKSRI